MSNSQQPSHEDHRPDFPPQPARYSAFATEQALDLWREGWQEIQRPALPAEWRRDYELAATAVAIAALHPCQTMQDLLRLYFRPHEGRAADRVVDPAIRGAIHDAEQHGRLLNWGLVEDCAFWLRYCQLVGRAVQSSNSSSSSSNGDEGSPA